MRLYGLGGLRWLLGLLVVWVLPQHAPAPAPAVAEPVPLDEALSTREAQILQLVADGLSNREIAEQIFLSHHTVEGHIKRIYRKLAVPSRTRAVHEARARGLLE